jgi:hypothetical protein
VVVRSRIPWTFLALSACFAEVKGGADSASLDPTVEPAPEPTDPSDLYDADRGDCVDAINAFRATLSLPPYGRWEDAEPCVDSQAQADSESGVPHSAFGNCGEFAQNECPGWPNDPAMIVTDCLQMMWDEGPGEDFDLHGHFINMSNPDYTEVSCGFYVTPGGEMWAVQDFR